jgi:hypothetical protein
MTTTVSNFFKSLRCFHPLGDDFEVEVLGQTDNGIHDRYALTIRTEMRKDGKSRSNFGRLYT